MAADPNALLSASELEADDVADEAGDEQHLGETGGIVLVTMPNATVNAAPIPTYTAYVAPMGRVRIA